MPRGSAAHSAGRELLPLRPHGWEAVQGRRLRPRQTLQAASSHASAPGAMLSSRASGQPRQGSPNIIHKASSCLFQRAPSHLSPAAQGHPVTTSCEGLDRCAHSGSAPVHQVRGRGLVLHSAGSQGAARPSQGPGLCPCALTGAEGKQTCSVSQSRAPPSILARQALQGRERSREEEEQHPLCGPHSGKEGRGKDGVTLIPGPRGGGVHLFRP